MANLHFRVPVTLDVRLELDDPCVRVPHWRTWPKERPGIGDELLLRFHVEKTTHTFVGYFDCGDSFVDSSGVTLFCPPGWDLEELGCDELVFRVRNPDEVKWIPLEELLESVEDPDESEEACQRT